jgi:hypothetical protein
MVTGIPIGWTATDWAETAQALPGADVHPLFPAVVAFAAMGATMRGDLERGAVLVTKAFDAQAALGTQHLWVHAAAGTLAFFRGDFDETVRHARAWEQAARQAGDPYEIAHALILLASGLTQVDDSAGVVAVEEAIRTARNAGIASALLYALMVRTSLPSDDPVHMLGLLDEAAQVGTQLGDRQGVANVATFRGIIAGRAGDWQTALSAFVDAVDLQLKIDASIPSRGSLWGVVFAFARLGSLEPATLLMGFLDTHLGRMPDHEFAELLASTDALLIQGLGEQQCAQLKAKGSTLDLVGAIAYLRAEAARALSE